MSAPGHTPVSTGANSGGATIPPMGIVLSIVAMLFLAAGAHGLMNPEAVPGLATPAVVWSLIAVGLVLDAAAIYVVLGARKTRRRRDD